MSDKVSENNSNVQFPRRILQGNEQYNAPQAQQDSTINIFENPNPEPLTQQRDAILDESKNAMLLDTFSTQFSHMQAEVVEESEDKTLLEHIVDNVENKINKISAKEAVEKVGDFVKKIGDKLSPEKLTKLSETESTAFLMGSISKTSNNIVKGFGNFQTWDKNIAADLVHSIEDKVVGSKDPMQIRKISFNGKTYRLSTSSPLYVTNQGLVNSIICRKSITVSDIANQQIKMFDEKFNITNRAKKLVMDKANAAGEYIKTSKPVVKTKELYNQAAEKFSQIKGQSMPAKTSASKIGGLSKIGNFLKQSGTKLGSGFGGFCKGLSKAVPFAGAAAASYDMANAMTKGLEQEGIPGMISETGKQGVKTATALATASMGMKGGAALGAFAGPVGAVIGGGLGAVGGYIVGSEAGEYICYGLEWTGGQIMTGAEYAWDGICWTGGQIMTGAEYAWDGICWTGDRLKDAGNWCGDKAVWLGDQISYGAEKVWNALKFW